LGILPSDSKSSVWPNSTDQTKAGQNRKKSADHLSKDGRWRSFSRVPHLLQYVSSGTYFARIKIKGKLIREILQTTVWSIAQLWPVNFLKKKQENHAHYFIAFRTEVLPSE
jgi:hypothetical protein